MKRLLVMAAILAGCGGDSPPAASPTQTQTPTPKPELSEPFDIVEEAGGTYLIADRVANAVFRLRGGELTTVAELPGPRDLEPAGEGRVLVASGRNVVELDTRSGTVSTVATARGEILGVARTAAGKIVVSDGGSRIVADGSQVLARGLRAAHGVLATGDGIVVCESAAGRVLVLNGRRRVLAKGLDLPSFAAPAPDGALYVTEFGANRVTHVTRTGAARTVAEIAQPTSLSVTADGDLVVAALNGHVARVDPATGRVESLRGP